MSHSRRRVLDEFFKAVDLGSMVGAFGLMVWLHPADSHLTLGNFFVFTLMMLAWHVCFQLMGLYRSQRQLSRREEAAKVLGATSVSSMAIFMLAGLSKVDALYGDPLMFVGIFWFVSTTVIISCRMVIRSLLERARMHGRNLRHVLIIGTNTRALHIADMIDARPKLGYRVVGFVDDDWGGLTTFEKTGRKLVSDFRGLRRFISNNVIDEVINTLPFRASLQQSSRILGICQEQGIPVRFVSPIFKVDLERAQVNNFLGESVITFSNRVEDDSRHVAKRTLDLLVSSLMLLACLPLFAVVALSIKLTSPGKVFFVQERMGLNKRRFKLFKFRTMVQDAEDRLQKLEHLNEVSGPVFKMKQDPRITRLGAFLRKTSIDELPQLINVFLGDMSLVGPRPLPVRDFKGFDQDWHRRRFSVRPGITCLWQVEGRSSIPFERWMELDMEYIDSWSLWLDIKILARTIPVVLTCQGAA